MKHIIGPLLNDYYLFSFNVDGGGVGDSSNPNH